MRNDLVECSIKFLRVFGCVNVARGFEKALVALGIGELWQALQGNFFYHASQCSVIERQFKLARIGLTPWPPPRSRALRPLMLPIGYELFDRSTACL
jgi:hypothetical protein